MPTKKPTEFNFETALAELNTLVEKMEKGGLSLEDSLTAFGQGIDLTRRCQVALANAEQTVQILLEKNGEPTLAPYNPPSEEV